jgi:hypothetical protein
MHHQLTRPHRPARLLTAAAVLAVATTIAACGSSSPNTASSTATSATSVASSGSDSTSSALAFSNCMRANGVPNFPDPTSGSGGAIRIQSSQRAGSGQSVSVNGVPVDAPAFQAAQQKCQKDLPTGGHPSASGLAALRAGALAMARCMRSHGVTDFPDPVISTGPGGGVGVQIGGPGVDPQSPSFQAAQKICGPLIQKAGGAGGSGSAVKAAG